MADPVSLALTAAVAGTAVSAYGSYEQGQASSKAYAYQSQVAQENAQIATQNASFAAAEGNEQVGASQMKNAQQVASIKASQAFNGIDVNSGSAVNVRSSQAELGELDALNIRANAARQAYGYQTQATSATAQGQLDTASSQNAATAGIVGGAGSLLTGAGNAGLNFANFQAKNGLTGDNQADITLGGGYGPATGDVTIGGGYA